MSSFAPFEPVAALLERSLTIKHVYGEPVHHGDTTVIPVAHVAFGFGAGGGRAPGGTRNGPIEPASDNGQPEAQGEGGGGGGWITPVGALEIGPHGTRFVKFRPLAPLLSAAAIGVLAGWLLGRRRG
jgi:uncharacterized spore protein YtfJ